MEWRSAHVVDGADKIGILLPRLHHQTFSEINNLQSPFRSLSIKHEILTFQIAMYDIEAMHIADGRKYGANIFGCRFLTE